MNVTVEATAFSAALTIAKRVVATKNTLPILSNVLLSAHENSLRVVATDLEVSFQTSLDAEVHAEGEITLPARALAEALRSAKAPVSLSTEGATKVEIVNGAAKQIIFGLPADEFPRVGKPSDTPAARFRIPVDVLRTLIATRCFSARSDETQYFLNAVYLHVKEDVLRCVATDSHALALRQVRARSPEGTDRGILIPRFALDLLDAVLPKSRRKPNGTVTVSWEKKSNHADFTMDDGTILGTRLVDGEYPAYEQIIPKELPASVRVNSDALRQGLDAVRSTMNPKTMNVHLNIGPDSIELTTSTPDSGSSSSTIPCEATTDCTTIGFNSNYVRTALDFLNAPEVVMEFREPMSATVWRSDADALALLMPLRVE